MKTIKELKTEHTLIRIKKERELLRILKLQFSGNRIELKNIQRKIDNISKLIYKLNHQEYYKNYMKDYLPKWNDQNRDKRNSYTSKHYYKVKNELEFLRNYYVIKEKITD